MSGGGTEDQSEFFWLTMICESTDHIRLSKIVGAIAWVHRYEAVGLEIVQMMLGKAESNNSFAHAILAP